MSDDFDPQAFLADFLTEANEHLATFDDGLLEAERLVAEGAPLEDDLVNALFRAIHTLKGMAGMMGFGTFTALAHEMEQVFDEVRRGDRKLSLRDVGILIEGLDGLKRVNARVAETGGEQGVALDGLMEAIAALARGDVAPTGAGPAEDLLGRIDAHEQMAALVAVAKGATLYQFDLTVGQACGDVGPEEWRAGLDLVGTVLGTWLGDGGEVGREAWPDLPADARVTVLLVTEADRQSVLDCTGVASAQLLNSPLPWQAEAPASASAPASAPLAIKGAERPGATGARDDAPAPAVSGPTDKVSSIRVETERLDRLMELVGEMVIHHTRLAQLTGQLSTLAESRTDEPISRERLLAIAGEFEEAMQVLGRVSDELQENTMKVRMVPVRSLFNRFPRIVRDLAKECGKSARLDLVGADTELDKTVVEQIGDPLIHLLRNGLDHGLEAPSERLAKGKPVEGVITLAASQEGRYIVIVVADDGHGIDRERVLAKARERRLIGEHEVLGDAEIFQLIFRPGFSTAEKVTNISGRGVGMDVVQQNIQRLGGSIQVLSEPNRGTRFVIKLPLTLAIAKALLVQAGGHTFATPLSSVEETLRLMPGEIKTVHEQEVIQVRGSVLPIFRLGRLFGMGTRLAPDAPLPVVVVTDGERRMGLAVDALLGQQDVVVKSLGDFLGQLPGIGGATILGDGRVALILDVATLLAQRNAPGPQASLPR